MNLTRALAVTNGYMSEAELVWLAEAASKHKHIVEIGSWTGRSTLALADNTPGDVLAVDTWLGSTNGDLQDILVQKGKDWAWKEFWKNIRHVKNIHVSRLESTQAAKLNRALGHRYDMVFIDASHDSESVAKDITSWRPLLESGGLLCGHDYTDTRWFGVKQAVDILVPDRKFMALDDPERTIWWTTV